MLNKHVKRELQWCLFHGFLGFVPLGLFGLIIVASQVFGCQERGLPRFPTTPLSASNILFIIVNAEKISAYATVVLAVITGIYVGLTGWYACMTNKILKESQKMRKAAEQQATAAHQQASAALATLAHMRERFADLHDTERTIVRTTIDSLVHSIDRWKKLDIKSNYVSAGAFPPPSDLLPQDAQNVLEHARVV